MENLIIRSMQISDTNSVAKMMHALAAFHGDETPVTEDDFASNCFGEKKLADAWVANLNGINIGFALTYDRMNFVRGIIARNLDLLFVYEEFRKKGIGKALVKAVIEDTLKMGHTRLIIGADPNNPVSNQFYKDLRIVPETKNIVRYALWKEDMFEIIKLLS